MSSLRRGSHYSHACTQPRMRANASKRGTAHGAHQYLAPDVPVRTFKSPHHQLLLLDQAASQQVRSMQGVRVHSVQPAECVKLTGYHPARSMCRVLDTGKGTYKAMVIPATQAAAPMATLQPGLCHTPKGSGARGCEFICGCRAFSHLNPVTLNPGFRMRHTLTCGTLTTHRVVASTHSTTRYSTPGNKLSAVDEQSTRHTLMWRRVFNPGGRRHASRTGNERGVRT
jgi:hypothetical protein